MDKHETLLRLQYMYDSNNPFMVGRRIEIENAIEAIIKLTEIEKITNSFSNDMYDDEIAELFLKIKELVSKTEYQM